MVNGYSHYDLTGQLEFWTDKDLVDFVMDSTTMMGLEKHHVIRLAQELAERFPIDDGEDDWGDDEEGEDIGTGRYPGREDNS